MRPITFGPRSAPLALTIGGAAILAATLLYMLLVPPASARGLVKRTRDRERAVATKIADAKERKAADEAILSRRKTALPPDAIGPDALARVTAFAKGSGLRLVGFRPQRLIETQAGPSQYPYDVVVEGPYPGVVNLARAIEGRTRDIALLNLQAASADAATDRVTATLRIALFRDPPPKPRSRTNVPALGTASAVPLARSNGGPGG